MQAKYHVCLFLALLMVPSVAEAHGPTRQKLTKKIEINAPAEKVWAVIKNFHDMSWHPAIEETKGEGGNALKSKRVLVLKGGKGATIEEELNKYSDEKMSYAYRITNVDVKVLPVSNYSSTITVKAKDDTTSIVEWKGAFYRGFPNNNPPPELNEEAAIKAVTGIYVAGLENVKKMIEAVQ